MREPLATVSVDPGFQELVPPLSTVERAGYRPIAAVTPELTERMKAHKSELIRLIDDSQAEPDSRAPTHELSIEERIAREHVNEGWTPRGWRERLQQMADGCEDMKPERAADLRRWADNVPGADGVIP